MHARFARITVTQRHMHMRILGGEPLMRSTHIPRYHDLYELIPHVVNDHIQSSNPFCQPDVSRTPRRH